MSFAKELLSQVPLYLALQRVVGADRLRYRCLDELGLSDGDVVLDVGCGPAYYLERMPAVQYFGFDTSEPYIRWAREQFGERAEFVVGVFSEKDLADLPPVDAIMLLGLLHHLDDQQARDLLSLCARALAEDGQVISVDTCFAPGQGRISRWMAENDRGEHVRRPEQFAEFALEFFAQVDGDVLNDLTRIPGTYWLMRMRQPRAAAVAEGSPRERRRDSAS